MSKLRVDWKIWNGTAKIPNDLRPDDYVMVQTASSSRKTAETSIPRPAGGMHWLWDRRETDDDIVAYRLYCRNSEQTIWTFMHSCGAIEAFSGPDAESECRNEANKIGREMTVKQYFNATSFIGVEVYRNITDPATGFYLIKQKARAKPVMCLIDRSSPKTRIHYVFEGNNSVSSGEYDANHVEFLMTAKFGGLT